MARVKRKTMHYPLKTGRTNMDSQLKGILENNEVDVVGTLARFMNNEELFVKFLYKFLEDENLKGLKESLEKKNYEEAFKFAHTLKGVTANLGLNSISNPVGSLVERLRGKQYDEELDEWLLKILENYTKLKEELLKYNQE